MNFKKNLLLLVLSFAVIGLPFSTAIALDDKEFQQAMDKFLAQDNNVEKITKALERFIKGQQAREAKRSLEQGFENPAKIDIGKSPTKGKANAPITIVEFSDFQCPYCQRGANTMDEVLKAYPNDVKLAFKNLPLPFHKEAKPAAYAALAAGEQGKFWEMHDELFKNQRNLKMDNFVAIAKRLGLDVEKFKKDMARPDIKKQVEDDIALANKLGIKGTPGFAVNGVMVRGARPLPYFKQIIEEWKRRMAAKG